MKKTFLLILALALLTSSCTSYDSWSRITTGMSLGAMFGSTVGGILGGYRGSDVGTLIGGAAGAAIGAASAQAAEEQRKEASLAPPSSGGSSARYRSGAEGEVRYGEYRDYEPLAEQSHLEVRNIVFADASGNRVLEPGEKAYVIFDIYNRSAHTIRDIAPIVTCDYKRVKISPTAIIGDLLPDQGMRYRAAIVASRRASDRMVHFDIAFPDHRGRAVSVRQFSLRIAD